MGPLLRFSRGLEAPWLSGSQVCIHQEDPDLTRRGVYGLGVYLRMSKELRVLWSSPYFTRPLCCLTGRLTGVKRCTSKFIVNFWGRLLQAVVCLRDRSLCGPELFGKGGAGSCLHGMDAGFAASLLVLSFRGDVAGHDCRQRQSLCVLHRNIPSLFRHTCAAQEFLFEAASGSGTGKL